LSFKVSKCQGVRVSRCHDSRVSGCQVVRVSECQVVRLSGCQVVRLSGCQVVNMPAHAAISHYKPKPPDKLRRTVSPSGEKRRQELAHLREEEPANVHPCKNLRTIIYVIIALGVFAGLLYLVLPQGYGLFNRMPDARMP